MHFKFLALAAAASTVVAQEPSFCDKYTTALFTNNTEQNQYALLIAVVNTAVIGNYSATKTGAVVPGILAPAEVGGTAVDLLPYFNGVLASTNQGEGHGVSVNFLDDGGASALKAGKPSIGKTSRQYLLLTHLYEYFGQLLGCSKQGGGDFPKYVGHPSMYGVHKYMVLNSAEVTYFIQQVAASALSFGVSTEDIAPVGKALMELFNYRCLPPTTVIPAQGAQPQSICTDQECPLAANSDCSGVETIAHPSIAIPGVVYGKNATYSNITHPGKPSYCIPERCPSGCKGTICPGGYIDDGSDESGHGSPSNQDGAGGAGAPGSGNNGGSGHGQPGSGSGSGADQPGSGSGAGNGQSGSDSGAGNGAGNGDYNPATVSTAGAAALGMSFIAVLGGGVAFFLL